MAWSGEWAGVLRGRPGFGSRVRRIRLAAQLVGDEGHLDSVVTVIDLLWVAFWLFLPGLFTVGVAASVVGFRSPFHPRWLGVIGIGVALTAFLPWNGLFVFVVWVTADSIRQPVKRHLTRTQRHLWALGDVLSIVT